MAQPNTKPPTGTRWIIRRSDLPQCRTPQQYEVVRDGQEPFTVTLEKRQRQVVDALRQSPLYCASTVRIGDVVHIVKRDHRLNIETLYFTEQDTPDPATFGVYVLRDRLTPVDPAQVAA